MAYTTIEQSKRLIEIGLDPETADATNHDDDSDTLTIPVTKMFGKVRE